MTAAVDTGDDNSSIYADDIIEVVSTEGRAAQSADQRFLIAKNHFGEKLRLPLSTPGKFSPQLDVKWYGMAEIINMGVFPQRVHLVSTQSGLRHRGHDKFILMQTELETNVLVTVNKELLALPLTAEIEVAIHETDEDQLAGVTELAVQDVPPSLPQVPNNAAVESSSQAACSTNPFHAEMSTSTNKLCPESPRNADLQSLSKADILRVKTGSVRRFGSQNHQPSTTDIEANAPEHVFEIYERLQNKMAECIRMREDANKWQARCQRLELQQQGSRKELQKLERMAEFWRDRVEKVQEVDNHTLQLLKEYVQNPTLAMGDIQQAPPPVKKPKPSTKAEVKKKGIAVLPTVVPAKEAQQVEVSPGKLSVADVQRLLTALNLQQYSKAFRDEQVDGGLLLELDDSSLQSDLGMKSSLHRKKLLRTMQGRGAPISELLSK